MEFAQIQKQVASKKFSPVYFFSGEEPFFIDKLTRQIEESVLNPGEESFNKVVFFGPDAIPAKVINEVRSFPMMANYRLVMVKEANRMKKGDFEKLLPLIENQVATTILVITWKDAKPDGRLKISKTLKEKAVTFESGVFYENQVGPWIVDQVNQRGFQIESEAAQAMVTYLGTNLTHIDNEIEKICIAMMGKEDKKIPASLVYDMVNIDKDFNVFELMNALGLRDHAKSHLIITQMTRNLKDNPPVMIVSQLFGFFNKLGMCQSRNFTSEGDIAGFLALPRFVARQYASAIRIHKGNSIRKNLSVILEADLLLKGVKPTNMGQEHIMKTMVYKLLN